MRQIAAFIITAGFLNCATLYFGEWARIYSFCKYEVLLKFSGRANFGRQLICLIVCVTVKISALGVGGGYMRGQFLIVAIFALCSTTAQLSAQVTGTRLGPKPAIVPDNGMSKDDISRLTMRSYARCVIGVQRKRIMEYLNSIPGSPDAYKLANNLSKDECLATDQLTFNEKLFRWTVYDELYNTSFRNFDVSKIAVVPNTDFVALANNMGAKGMEIAAVWQLGECSVRAAPKEADALVKSAIGSKTEASAINAIVPQVGGCVDQDSQIKFSKPVLRGLMAEALYKLAKKSEDMVVAKSRN